MKERLLTLSEAAERLGVHPATVRRWADKGEIEVRVTAGGHRRFPESAVERMARGPSALAATSGSGLPEGGPGTVPAALEQRAITATRSEIRHHADESWMANLSEAEREEKRLLGRRLVGLMMQYLSRDDDDGHELLSEARAIGRLYARTARQSGVELADALKATMFFRDNLVETAILLPETTRGRPDASSRVYRRINEFLNAVQLAVAEVYDAPRGAAEKGAGA